jgi:berberine-like enzyme
LTVVPAGRDITDYSDAGETLDAALSPWRLQMGHPSFQGPADATVGTRQAFDLDTYAWLQTVKAKYHSNNNFRVNHNIPPTSPV